MPEAFFFSKFRESGKIELKGVSSIFRKVTHSGFQSAKTSASNFGSAIKAPFSGNNKLGGTANLVLNVGDKAGQAGGALGLVAGALAMTGSAAAWVAAVGGPQVAVTAGVIGIAVLVKATYSNREGAHEKLRPFVYNLIDDSPPKRVSYEEAAGPAAYLMKEADAQFAQMGNKLKVAEDKFENFFTHVYGVAIQPLLQETSSKWIGQVAMDSFNTRRSLSPSDRGQFDHNFQEVASKLFEAKEKADKLLAKSQEVGGEIYEFVRRLDHVGNYLQCARIVDRAIFLKLGKNPGITANANEDMLRDWSGTQYYRNRMATIGKVIEKAQTNITRFADYYAMNKGQINS